MKLGSEALKQGELWGKAARDWAGIQEPPARPLWEAALDAAGVAVETRLLDAGCGSGGAAVLAAARGAQVAGVDVAAPLLTIARERLVHGDFRIADIDDLPFSNESFDAVVALNSVQFAADPALAVFELSRVCRAGGRVVVAVWDAPEVSDNRVIFEAMLSLFESRPSSKGPFALSEPGLLEALMVTGDRLRLERVDVVECPFVYPDMDTAVNGQLASGSSQRAIEIHGAQRVTQVVRHALKAFQRGDGTVLLTNRFRQAVAVRPK